MSPQVRQRRHLRTVWDRCHARLEAGLPVAAHSVRGHGDDGDVRRGTAFASANAPGSFPSVDGRHLHVHQHQAERRFLNRRERRATVALDGHSMSPLLDRVPGEQLVDGVDLSQQDTQLARGSLGPVTQRSLRRLLALTRSVQGLVSTSPRPRRVGLRAPRRLRACLIRR